MSLSSGERELKLVVNKDNWSKQKSLSSGERELKLFFLFLFLPHLKVALFRRAWIEISFVSSTSLIILVALFRRAWIEISSHSLAFFTATGRSLQESVNWNQILWNVHADPISRSLQESVNWNTKSCSLPRVRSCRSLQESVNWNGQYE